ncbi:MAG: TonB-dependent receptor [Methylococcaceae bacterium]|nr:TonB-dependent receptor [Methylococcaceae bacterium]
MNKKLGALIGVSLSLPLQPVGAEESVQAMETVQVTAEPMSWLDNWLTEDSHSKPVQARTELGQLTKTTAQPGSILDRTELETVKYVDILREQFNRIPGVSMVRNMRIPDGGKSYSLNLVDGLLINSPMSQSFTTMDQFNPAEIERIEVIRGPGSVLYPSNNIAGSWNLITRDPTAIPEYRLSQEYGTDDFWRTQGSATGMLTKDLGYFAGFSYMDRNGWRDREGINRGSASGKLVYKPDDVSKLTLRLEHVDYYEESPSSLDQIQFDRNWLQADYNRRNLYQDFEYLTGSATYKRQIGDGGELTVAFTRREQNGWDGNSGGGSGASNAKINQIDYAENNGHAVYRQDFDFIKSRVYTGLDVINGTQFTTVWDRALNTFDLTGLNANAMSATDETQIAPFMQYEFSPLNGLFTGNRWLGSLDNLRFNFGLRHEEFEQQIKTYNQYGVTLKDGSNTYKRLIKKGGLSWEYTPDHVLWFGMADGWLVPNTSATVTSNYPNYDIHPETSITKQIGLRGFFRDYGLSYDIDAYESNISDYIGSVYCSQNPSMCPGWAALRDTITRNGVTSVNTAKTTATYSTNAGAVTARGFETSLSYRPHELVKFDAAHTLTWNTWDVYYSGNTRLQNVTLSSSPKHHVNGRVTVYPLPGWSVEFEADYISKYYTNVQNTDAYQRPMLFNLRTAYKWQNWTLSLQAINLFDTKYSSRVSATDKNVRSYTGLAGTGDGPFTFRAGLSYQF